MDTYKILAMAILIVGVLLGGYASVKTSEALRAKTPLPLYWMATILFFICGVVFLSGEGSLLLWFLGLVSPITVYFYIGRALDNLTVRTYRFFGLIPLGIGIMLMKPSIMWTMKLFSTPQAAVAGIYIGIALGSGLVLLVIGMILIRSGKAIKR